MALSGDGVYFPSLDNCLTGKSLLISWKSAWAAITTSIELDTDHKDVIEKFFEALDATTLLAKPFEAFQGTSPQSKAIFDNKTSAINATPSQNTKYDLSQVKEDALWLSKVAKVDEVSALRAVVVECQARSSAQLLGPFSEDELVGIKEAAGNSKYSSPIPLSLLSQASKPAAIQQQFEKESSRRRRILQTYLSERRHFLKCAERLIHAAYIRECKNMGKDKTSRLETQSEEPKVWLAAAGRSIYAKMEPGSEPDRILEAISLLQKLLKNIETGSGWSGDFTDADLELQWMHSQIIESVHAMELIWQYLTYVIDIAPSGIMIAWFRLQKACKFFSSFETEAQSVQADVLVMQSTSMLISLNMIALDASLFLLEDYRPEETSATVSPDEPYLSSSQTLIEVHGIIMEAADSGFMTAGPAVLAWTYILQGMAERVNAKTLSQSQFDPVSDSTRDDIQIAFEDITSSFDGDLIEFLGLRAVETCRVFETITGISSRLGTTSSALYPYVTGCQMRILTLTLLNCALGLGYIPELIQAIIATLSGGRDYWNIIDSKGLLEEDDPVALFINNEKLVHATILSAQRRYPFESLPFLQMVRALAASPATYGDQPSKSIIKLLGVMPVFTYVLPSDFAAYETAQEEENNNTIRLKQPIDLFESRSKLSQLGLKADAWALTKHDPHFRIPAGSMGRMVIETSPRVAYWYHEYPALKYFGKLLETFLASSHIVDATTGSPADPDSVSEIINVIATILASISRSVETNPNSQGDARHVLEHASAGLSRNRDITSVIFDIFEQELQNTAASNSPDNSMAILVSCVTFIHAMVPLFPGRVWPLLTQCGLLGIGRGGGQLSTIVEGVELVVGRYEFLSSCSRLYAALVNDFTTNAILRRGGGPSLARFQDGEDVGTGIPEQALSSVLLAFTRYLVEVLESSCTWKFQEQDERQQLNLIIGAAFNNMLQYAYGIESWSEDSNKNKTDKPAKVLGVARPPVKKQKTMKIMDPLLPSASHIVDTFLSSSSGVLRFQPLLHSYFDGLNTPDSTIYVHSTNLRISHVTTLLALATTLLQVSKLLDRPSSQLEKHIFKASPLIARLYAAHDIYRNPVVALLESLIVTAASGTEEPPSILGHLGTQTARNFLHMLADLDGPLSRALNVTSIWKFLSMVVGSRQQWFAIYLLTGGTPRDAIQSGMTGRAVVSLDKPLLTTALEKLMHISMLPQPETLAILEFIALAHNYWPWLVSEAPLYAGFVKNIADFAGNLKPLQKPGEDVMSCYQTRIAGQIAEILAMHLFHSRQIGAAAPLKELKDNVSYFSRFAVNVPTYNASLHAALKRNLEGRFSGCKLQDLKKTTLQPRQIGDDFFYDLNLADKMLQHDSAWLGQPDNGLRKEIILANINLSLVDAQLALFQSWKSLAIELSLNMQGDEDLERIAAEVVNNCLVANTRAQPPEDIFARLSLTRTDFALVLSQRLIQANSTIKEVSNLLSMTWKAITALRGAFERAVADDDILYYRSLLKLLFLAIRVHSESKPEDSNLKASTRLNQSAPIIPTILEILKYVVSMGLRELASSIHDAPAESSPEDLSVITGILQSCLRIPGIELYQTQIMNIMASNSTPRIALTLFSWSDKLAIDGDPIYGELSILFLLELSRIPLVAEQLAIDGVLGNIASASITAYLRRPGIGPFSESAGLQRCYSIWARGILPLLLSLVDAVQGSIAAEVALFLNQFPTLVTQSEQALDAPETNRILRHGQAKYVTLTVCSEVHSMALLTFILNGFRNMLNGSTEIPEVKWDSAGVLENAEFWLSSRALLRERILPMGEREVAMVRKKTEEGKTVSALENKIVAELNGIRDVLSGGNDS